MNRRILQVWKKFLTKSLMRIYKTDSIDVETYNEDHELTIIY